MKNMTKEKVNVRITAEFKEKVMNEITSTIEKVASTNGVELSKKDKVKLRNLALDQVNVNITNRINSKTLWDFSSETSIPVSVDKEPVQLEMGSIISKKRTVGYYTINPNLSWSFTKKKKSIESLSKQMFEEKVRLMFLEDSETAAFYGAMSFTDGDL